MKNTRFIKHALAPGSTVRGRANSREQSLYRSFLLVNESVRGEGEQTPLSSSVSLHSLIVKMTRSSARKMSNGEDQRERVKTHTWVTLLSPLHLINKQQLMGVPAVTRGC